MRAAVVGVGVMGSAIAGRLLERGVKVILFDRDPMKLASLLMNGGKATRSAAEATQEADLILTSLNTATTVDEVVFGAEGIVHAGTPDKLLIDMSSIDAAATASMAKRLLERCGMGWVDAPLSGGAPAAAAGRLTLFLGGREEDVSRAGPTLDLLAANKTHFGPPGAGQTVKLINQILCASTFMAVAEAVRFAEVHGVDPARIPAALAGGRADSRILQEFMGKMAARDFSPTGRIDNMLKDLETVQAAAHAKRVAMPLTSLIADLHRMLVAGGLGPSDSAEYVRLSNLARDIAQ